MAAYLTENIGTILITILLVLIVAGIIHSMIRDKKRGKSLCSGNCSHCRMCSAAGTGPGPEKKH